MSAMSEYNIDLWNAAFELKSISTKWGINVTEFYKELEHIITSDELMEDE